MRSKSVEQLSSIKLIFEPGTDLMEARQLVQETTGNRNPAAANLGRAALHAAATFIYCSYDEDRDFLG